MKKRATTKNQAKLNWDVTQLKPNLVLPPATTVGTATGTLGTLAGACCFVVT